MADLIAELARIGHVANRDTPSFTDRTMCLHFLRTHHAEIAAAVRDASRYRWLRDTWGGWMAIGGKMQADIRTPSWRGDWPSFDAAIDSAMRAGEGEG